jgi:hypothetical protein
VKIKMKPGVDFRDEIQREIYDFMIGANEYESLAHKPRRAIFADTDTGKTFLNIKLICETGLAPIIVCPDDRAIRTWTDEFLKFTEIDEKEIGVVKGVDSIPSIIKRKESIKVVLLSNRTASSIFKDEKDYLLVELFVHMGFGLKVYDELHMGLQTIFYMEMLLVSYRTFYLTATNSKRIWGEQKALDHMTPPPDCVWQPPPIPKFEYIEIAYFSNVPAALQKGINKPGGFDALAYLSMISAEENSIYGRWVLEKVVKPAMKFALKNLSEEGNKIAILTKTNESGEWIARYIAEEFPQLSIGFFNSKKAAKYEDRLPELEKNVIMSTDRSFAGIINIKALEIIINVTPVTAEAHVKQIAGRLRKEKDKRRMFIQLGDCTFKKARSMLQRERKTMEPVTVSMERITVGKAHKEVEEADD